MHPCLHSFFFFFCSIYNLIGWLQNPPLLPCDLRLLNTPLFSCGLSYHAVTLDAFFLWGSVAWHVIKVTVDNSSRAVTLMQIEFCEHRKRWAHDLSCKKLRPTPLCWAKRRCCWGGKYQCNVLMVISTSTKKGDTDRQFCSPCELGKNGKMNATLCPLSCTCLLYSH